MKNNDLPSLIEAFFTKRLIAQRRVSPNTVSSYRYAFTLLFEFAQKRLGRPPSKLQMVDLNAPFLSEFLDHLEATRKNSARTRNLRRTAIRSFLTFAALETPEHAGLIQRSLAIPTKRCSRPLVGFLLRPEIEALLAAVDRSSWIGRRDHALMLVAMQTGLRLAELTSLRRQDLTLGPGAHIFCLGKGRKERATPIAKATAGILAAWLKEQANSSAYLFPSMSGGRLSHDAVQDLVKKYKAIAGANCPSIARKKLSPHRLRHTAAMEWMQSGVDRSMIAMCLGHESVETTQIYLDANLALKENILAKTSPIDVKPKRFRPDDRLLAFLSSL